MKTKIMKCKDLFRRILYCFFIIIALSCCFPQKSYAKINNRKIELYPNQASTTSESATTSITNSAPDTGVTSITASESEAKENAQSRELTAPNATVIGAGMALLGVFIGALINFGSTAYSQHMQRNNAREERKEAKEYELLNKKKEAYFNYLNTNKTIFTKLINSEEIEENSQLLINLNEASLWIEIYGSDEINQNVNIMNSYLNSEAIDTAVYTEAYNRFLILIKEDLKISSSLNTHPEVPSVQVNGLDDTEETLDDGSEDLGQI